MAVAVTIEQAREALSRLDPESRALLELSTRRGMDADEIAGVLRVDPAEEQRRVGEVFDRLARELSLERREERAELRATLPDLPANAWTG